MKASRLTRRCLLFGAHDLKIHDHVSAKGSSHLRGQLSGGARLIYSGDNSSHNISVYDY